MPNFEGWSVAVRKEKK